MTEPVSGTVITLSLFSTAFAMLPIDWGPWWFWGGALRWLEAMLVWRTVPEAIAGTLLILRGGQGEAAWGSRHTTLVLALSLALATGLGIAGLTARQGPWWAAYSLLGRSRGSPARARWSVRGFHFTDNSLAYLLGLQLMVCSLPSSAAAALPALFLGLGVGILRPGTVIPESLVPLARRCFSLSPADIYSAWLSRGSGSSQLSGPVQSTTAASQSSATAASTASAHHAAAASAPPPNSSGVRAPPGSGWWSGYAAVPLSEPEPGGAAVSGEPAAGVRGDAGDESAVELQRAILLSAAEAREARGAQRGQIS
jgi:hypothetical protein